MMTTEVPVDAERGIAAEESLISQLTQEIRSRQLRITQAKARIKALREYLKAGRSTSKRKRRSEEELDEAAKSGVLQIFPSRVRAMHRIVDYVAENGPTSKAALSTVAKSRGWLGDHPNDEGPTGILARSIRSAIIDGQLAENDDVVSATSKAKRLPESLR